MEKLQEAMERCRNRWPAGKCYLVGLSGGVDSVVLLRSLVESGYQKKLIACHLDHGLRGRTAAADARWAERLAGECGVRFVGERENVRALADERGISIETAGRQARHRFFRSVAAEHRSKGIFLAHHADDQAETALMNLCRGSAGLQGMVEELVMKVPGFRTGLKLMRPLLGVPKAELRRVAAERSWGWREDAGNAVGDVVRNRMRLEVLPLLEDIFRRPVGPAVARAAEWDRGVRDFLEAAAADWISMEKLPVRELEKMSAVLRDTVLAGWLRAREVPDVSAGLIARVVGMLSPESGPARWNGPGNVFIRRRAGWLWVERVPACGKEGG